MKPKAFHRSISVLAGAAMLAVTVAGAAQAQGLGDLVGMNTERAHQILASRGYQQTRMDPGSSGNRYFWWNGARAGCVAISGYYGRVARVDIANPAECGIGPGPGGDYGDIPGLRAACAAAADRYWRVRPGSSTTGRAHDLGYAYRIRVELGGQSAHCVITKRGQVQSID
jgi:hypothetical protein